ncbi:MAG: Ycf66 family protein, partial [Waterburya sp.]
MVNFGLNAAAILGLFLAVAGAGLFFLRSIRPELARDYDIFFAAVGLLCGIILLFNGWRLDPILQFGQFLLTGTAIFFAFESVRMRGVATEQARKNTPTVDRDRPVSRTRVYTEAELDQIDPYDNYDNAKPNYNSPRLRGYDDPQPRATRRPTTERRRPSSAPEMDVRDEPRRSRSRNRPETGDYAPRNSEVNTRNSYTDQPAAKPSRPRRRPSPGPSPKTADSHDNWNAKDEWDEKPSTSARPRPRPRPTTEERYSEPTPPPTSRRGVNPADLGRSYEEPEE